MRMLDEVAGEVAQRTDDEFLSAWIRRMEEAVLGPEAWEDENWSTRANVLLKNGPFDVDIVFAPDGIEGFEEAWNRGVDIEGSTVCSMDDIIDPGMVRIAGVRFIGATLRTDLLLEGKADEIGAHMRVSREISDFRGAIQYQGRDFATGESVERHRADRRFVEQELKEAERAGDRVVVITHHAPSPRSIRPWFEGDPFNCAFAPDLDPAIDRFQPAIWIHGHLHDPVDERLGRTQVVANPAGYAYEKKEGLYPGMCVDLEVGDRASHGKLIC